MQLSLTQKRAALWLALGLAVGLLLALLGPVLAPFGVAAVLAYALSPLVAWMAQRCRGLVPRWLVVALVELVFGVLLLGVLLLVLPVLSREWPLIREQLPALLDRLNQQLGPWLAQWGMALNLDVESLKAFVLRYLNANGEDALASAFNSLRLGGSLALALVGHLVLIPVALFYLLLEWPNWTAGLRDLVPPHLRATVLDFADEADAVLGQYLRGQLLVMLILAVFYALGLGLFGLQLALPIGVFTGLAIFVPYLGFGVGLVLALLSGLLQFMSTQALVMVAVVYGLGQLLESFVLTPRLVGERIGLHPLAVIFALLALGQLLGFVGVLTALPLSAVLCVALRRMRRRYLDSALYRG